MILKSLLYNLGSNLFIIAALKLEKKLERKEISEKKGNLLASANVLSALMLPVIYLWYRRANPG